MGTASSAHKTRIADGCQMCKRGAKIEWQCKECNLFLCGRCKITEHEKFSTQHEIISKTNLSTINQQAQVPIGCHNRNLAPGFSGDVRTVTYLLIFSLNILIIKHVVLIIILFMLRKSVGILHLEMQVAQMLIQH